MMKRNYNLSLELTISRKSEAETLLDSSFHGKSVHYRNIHVVPQRKGAVVCVDVDMEARYPSDVRVAARQAAQRAIARSAGKVTVSSLEVIPV